jgi:hypothetical protein
VLIGTGEHRFAFLRTGGLIARRQEARPYDFGRVAGKERMDPGGLLDAGGNLGLAFGDGPARQDADAAIDVAPGRNARGPVSAFDDAGIEIERVVDFAKEAMVLRALVPLRLEAFEALDQVVGGLDGIRARTGARDVDGQSRTFRRNQITPTWARISFPSVGSGSRQASAR